MELKPYLEPTDKQRAQAQWWCELRWLREFTSQEFADLMIWLHEDRAHLNAYRSLVAPRLMSRDYPPGYQSEGSK